MHRIVNNLWLGSQRDADELIRKNPEGITAILNVRGPDAYDPPGRNQSGEHPGKAYKWIPAPDTEVIYPSHVREATSWLKEQTEKGQRILIHCMHGISRAPGFLAAHMVATGISASLEEAKAMISAHRTVQPATQLAEIPKRVVLVSALTGLPNLRAFEEGNTAAFVAIADVDVMHVFNDVYGRIAGDALLARLGKILISVRLDAYHSHGDDFLCKAESREELSSKLSQAQQLFKEAFRVYANGGIQTIEGTDFSFGIGANPGEREAALSEARKTKGPPEWLRKIMASGGSREIL